MERTPWRRQKAVDRIEGHRGVEGHEPDVKQAKKFLK
jgi:hypothetical protein